MRTSYEDCFESFLSHCNDPTFLFPEEDETDSDFEDRMHNTLLALFKGAVVKFFFSKTSLSRNDVTEMFDNELRPIEIEIIALLMLKEYYRKQMDFLVALKHSFSDKDFKSHDKSNQLNQYRQMLKETDLEIQGLLKANSLYSSTGNLDGWWSE